MNNFLNKVINKFSFMKEERSLFRKVIDYNKKENWKVNKDTAESVMVDGIIKYFDIIEIARILYGAGISEKMQYNLIVVDYKTDKKWKNLIKSYNASLETLRSNVIRHPLVYLGLLLKALYLVSIRCSGERLVNMTENGVPFGELIYEGILRERHILTIEKLNIKDLKYVILGLFVVKHATELSKKYKTKYYISFNNSYIDAIYLKTATRNGSRGVLCPAAVDNEIMEDENGHVTDYADHFIRKDVLNRYNKISDNSYIEFVNNYFQNRFKGKVDVESLAAYANKKVITRDEFQNNFNLEPGKKIVTIFSHCFSDACRRSELIYRDFYEWLIETVKVLSDNPNVYTFIKIHPMHVDYKEYDPTFDIVSKYNKNKNLFVFPDEISTESIYGITDAIVTCYGTIGIEAPCFGVPVLLGGNSWYSSFSFSKYYEKEEDYKTALLNIHNLTRLTPEEINEAKKVYYSYLPIYNIKKDDFFNTFSKIIKSADNYRTKTINGLQFLIKYMDEKDIRQNSYYLEGVELAKRDNK